MVGSRSQSIAAATEAQTADRSRQRHRTALPSVYEILLGYWVLITLTTVLKRSLVSYSFCRIPIAHDLRLASVVRRRL
jgi:hypothetical protein